MGNREDIGIHISELRKRNGMTQEELAEASGVDRTNISKIESGVYNVSIVILSKIAAALKCTVEMVSDEELLELQNIRMIKKAKAIFAFYEAESEDVKVFGDWAVNNYGDIINYAKRYPIYYYDLIRYNYDKIQTSTYWYDHISEKYDFDAEHFLEAFEYAFPIAKKKNEELKAAQ